MTETSPVIASTAKQSSSIAGAGLPRGSAPRNDALSSNAIEVLRTAVAPLTGGLRIEMSPPDPERWIGRDALCDPDAGPLADLNARFAAAGFGANRKAVSASLLLRFGWAAGFTIGAWLVRGAVVRIDDYALSFSASTLVEGLWVRDATIVATRSGEGETAARAAFRDAMLAFSEPLVERHHHWSGFSRHALWAMITSSWSAQAVAIADRVGRRADALAEMDALFADAGPVSRAAPEVYEVAAGTRSLVCQKRAACCLYFKGPRRHFCASCPIIPAAERLDRNVQWVAAAA
jgi:hypothetical protein